MASSLRELVVSVTANTTRYQSEMQRAGRMATDFGRTVQQTAPQAVRAWDMQSAAVRTHATAMEASTQALGRYATAVAGAFGVRELIGMADDWGQLNARIRQAAGASDDFGEVQSRLEEIANRTFRRYSEAADQFVATARPMRELGFATRDTLDAAEALGLALVAGGSNAQRGAAAQDAWAKSVVQGKIATDQFQTLLLQTPRVVQALSDGLGKSTAELQQMATDGELLISRVLPALTSQMGTLREEVDRMPTTVQDATNRLLDGLQRWAGGTNEATGATGLLVRGLDLLTRHIDEVATLAMSAGIGVLGSKMVMAGKGAVEAAQGFMQAHRAQVALTEARVRDAREAVVEAAIQKQTLMNQRALYASMMATAATKQELTYATTRYERAAERAAAATKAHQLTVDQLRNAEMAAATATNRFAAAGRGLLALVGGPGGLALTIGTVAAGWLMFRDNTDETREALIDLNATLDETIAKYVTLNRAQQAGAMLTLSDKIDDDRRKISETLRLMANEADFTDLAGTFGPGLQQLERAFLAGRMSADEFSNAVAKMADELAATGQIEEVQRRGLIRYAETIGDTSRRLDENNAKMGALTGQNDRLAAAADNSAASVRGQASALRDAGSAADEARKRIQQALATMPGQIARIGKSPVEIARMDGNEMVEAAIASGRGAYTRAGRPNEALRQIMDEARQNVEWTQKLVAAQEAYERSTKAASAAEAEAKRRMDETKRAADQLAERYADLEASQRREIELYGQTGRAAQLAYDLAHGALQQFSETQKAVLLEQAAWLDQLDEIAVHEEAVAQIRADHAKAVTEQVDRMTVYAEQAGRNIQTALGDSLYDILDGRFSDIGDSFANMLKRMVAELAASQLLNVLGGAMAGYGGTGKWGNLIRGIGGAMQTSGSRAGGGRVEAFKAYDIAEHGQPEILSYGGRNVLIMGAQGGMVSPLMNVKGGGAGATTSGMRVEIINSGAPAKVESASMIRGADGTQMLKIFIGAVAGDIANGGPTAAAVRSRFGLREAV